MPSATIASNDRAFICGKTGSGKTYLARYLTDGLKRLVVLDSKGRLGDWGLESWDKSARRALTNQSPVRARVTAPMTDDVSAFWDEVMLECYNSGNVTVYVDELYLISESSKPSTVLRALYTQGRELGIGTWASTQRPAWVALFAISESEHYFMFRLTLEEDRRRMSSFMTDTVMTPIPDAHGFYYMEASQDLPVYSPGLKVRRSG